jgi:AraC-like DNA-binding protein
MLPPDLRYERYAPSATLAPYVEFFWLVANDLGATSRSEILIPNGRPMVLACLGDRGIRVDIGSGARQPNGNLVAGIQIEPLVIEQSGKSIYVAAQLTPFGLGAFADGGKLIDKTRSFEDWIGGNAAAALVTEMRKAELGEPAVRVLEEMLESRCRPLPDGVPSLLAQVIGAVEESEALIGVEQLADRFALSYSALYRLFRTHVGIPPKQFIAVSRYYRLVGVLLMGNFEGGLAHLALLQGYYDQAHATKEFRRFTGVSQTAFKASLNGIARLMHRQ